MLEKLKELFGSRKFWAGIIGAVLTYINSQIKLLDDVQMANIIVVITGWIIGQSIVDASAAKK